MLKMEKLQKKDKYKIIDICETKQKKGSNIKKRSFFKYQFRRSNKKTKNYTTNNPKVIVKNFQRMYDKNF